MAELTLEGLREVLMDVVGITGLNRSGRGAGGANEDVKGVDWKGTAEDVGKLGLAATGLGAGLLSGNNALGKMSQGAYGAHDALDNMNGIVGAAGGHLGAFGTGAATALKNISGTAMQVNDNLKKLSNAGVYFGNDLGKYSQLITGARTSMDHFNDLVSNNATALGSFGGNMDEAAENYLKLAGDLQEHPIAGILEKTGMGIDELNDTLLSVTARSRMFNAQDNAAKQRAIEASLSLSNEMDTLARLTGISRKEMQATIDKEREKAQSKIAEAMMTPEERARYQKGMAQAFAIGGEQAKVVFAEAFRNKQFGGAITSTAGREAYASDARIMEQIQQMGVAEGKGESSQQFADSAQMMMESTLRTEGAYIAASAEGQQSRAELIAAGAQNNAAIAKIFEESNGDMKVFEEKKAEYMKGVMESKLANTESGKPSDAAAVSQASNALERFSKDLSAGIGTSMPKLNESTGKTINSFDLLTKKFNNFATKSPEEIKKTAGFDKVENMIKGEETEGRAGGSLGATGSLIEDFGAGKLMTLHGKEGVITEGQLNQILGQVGSTGFAPPTSVAPNLDVFKQINDMFNTEPAKPDEKGMFDTLTDMFYDVGNVAGKMFDDITKDSIGKTSPDSSADAVAQKKAQLEKEQTEQRAAKEKSELEEKRQQEIRATANANNVKAPTKPEEPIASATMNDLKDQLIELNKNVKDLISHTDKVAEHTEKQYRTTKNMNGSRI